MDREADPVSEPPPLPGATHKKRSFWRTPAGILVTIALGLATLLLAALAALRLAIQFGYLPDSAAVSGDRLKSHVIETLRNADILEADEQVGYYDSTGLFSYLEDGNLFTNQHVISYWLENGELQIAAATFAEVEGISVKWSDSWLEDTEITARLADGGELLLFVAKENGGDRKFYAALESAWHKHR